MHALIFYISLLSMICMACGTTNQNIRYFDENIRYFDENNVEISKSKFYEIRSTNAMLDIPGDSVSHRILTTRGKRGVVTNIKLLKSLLEKTTLKKLDNNKPIVIIFYPGKDSCNSIGIDTKRSIQGYKELEEGIRQIANIKPIYIYKDNKGLEKYSKFMTWHPDPNKIIEKLFFKYHYPCYSFVVISKSGEFISYFGEFPNEYVWEITMLMNE